MTMLTEMNHRLHSTFNKQTHVYPLNLVCFFSVNLVHYNNTSVFFLYVVFDRNTDKSTLCISVK